MQLTTENTKEFIEFWNNNKPEGFIHPMHEGIATVILDYLDQAEYQLTLEDNKVTIFDQQTNEELGEYTPEELFWKARLLIESNNKDSRSSTNHYNNLLDIFSNKELSPKEYKEQIRDELQNYYFTKECFNKNDELKWNSINYTTKNWIEIENIYYEYEETRGFLSIGDSLTDLEEEYGENNFPEEAVEDGRLLIDEQGKLEEYIINRHNLKCFSDVEELLWDYEYQTKDVLKYYIPKIDNEQLEELTDIVDSQNINLESLREISFEDIYNEIDKSKLNEVQLEELNKIKEDLSKPTVEIFKQSFDSFIMSLSEAASKSIQTDIENIKAKALYVFNVDNNEYTIVSKRDSENPFMVHKYYPENETGGIHHGSYDIDTYESAEKIAANRLINEQKEKYELINFIAGTREEDFNLELKNELSSVFEYLNEYSLNEEDQIELIDVKAYQYEGPSGKLKVLVEYKGNCREDDLFNLLHDDEENGQDGHDYEINGYKIDLNPIKAEKSGTISEYLAILKNVEEKWPEVIDIVEVFRVNGILISEEDKKDFETFFNYHMEINTQSFFKKNEKLYLEDEVAGSKELVDKEFLLGKLESYIQTCNDSNDEYLQVHKNLFSKYIQEQESQMYKKIHTKDSTGYEEWQEYDDKGNVIYYKDSTGNEHWKEYDEKGNLIHLRNNNGYEQWYEYDDKGNVIHKKDSYGVEQWQEYDDKGNVIYYKDSYGDEHWREYDEKGNEIHFENSIGNEHWTEYDEKGNEIHFEDSTGDEYWTEYDEKGNQIHYKNSDGYEEWKEYDEKGNEIHFKNSSGFERWTEYDDKGNVIHYKDSDGYEKLDEYDEKGNVIHHKNFDGSEVWREYDDKGNEIHYKNSNGYEEWTEYDEKGNEIHYKDFKGFERSSTVVYLTKEQYLQEKNNSTQEEHSISVDYAFPDDLTYKKEDGNEIKITIYEEPRWDFEDNNELLNIIKEADEDYYDEIKKIITENPSRKFDFDLGKSLRYDDNTFYNSFHIDYSKETLSQKLDNKFIVRYWTTDDTSENKLPQISNYDFAGEDSTIIILNNELSEKLNSMIREHVKNNIDAFENYKTYRNEQISKVLYAEIKQHGEPIITINEDGKTNARFQTFTISNDLHNLLELPHFSWHDAQTGKSYPYQYALYADFELDENSIDETKEPEIKYFEFIDDGTKEIQSADSMKRNSGLLEQNQSIKEVITNTFKQVAQEYYNQNVSIELPLEQQNETTKQLTTENTEKTQMYKKIHIKDSDGEERWAEYDSNGHEIYFKDSEGGERWKEYDDNGNEIHFKTSDGIEDWTEYDDKGNEIHFKDSGGFERWKEYDDKGNVIHFENSSGDERWYEYDDNGNEIYFKDSDGYEHWKEYDEKGNVIHFKGSDGFEHWREYDEKGNEIHFKNSDGFESWNEYDDNGNEIHYKDSEGDERWREYDDKGNVIHYKDSNRYESWTEYDDNGNQIHFKDSDSFESWTDYDDNGNEIHYKASEGDEHWKEYDDKGNVIHFKNSDSDEHWKEYDDKGNVIYYKDSKGFERSSTIEYVSKEQYLQEKNNSQIETKYTKADINDLQSFFFPYPQLSESLCYQILDDFELYQIPLFKDSDGNIYQREMNTDLAEGDERDYQLLTQDGIIDQEYNWLIDRKYTSEDEIDLQKELEDIKKFEENPKSYYKNIFKVALEKEIEKVKKEINEGNVKDVIEKNILEIAEEKIGSHAVPEEIIGWYISDDEKNYFENWKNSGDFPDYKEALDSMFAYVYEHDTTKQNLRYVSELNETTQNKLKTLLQEHFEKEGLSEGEIKTAIQNAIDSKIDDLNQLMESNEKIKSLFTNEKEWQQAVYEWNERKQGTNSEFKSIGTLIEVDSTDEQQIESLRKNTKEFNIDQKEAKALLSMVNYDSSSFEFMFDIDNGNFVEIDKKNKKIIDVATSKNILGYLTDEIKYIIKEEVSESFTVEELFNANVLNNVLEYINKEPRYFQDLNKVEKEAVISGYWEAPDPDMYEKVVEEFYYKKGLKEPEPGLVQYPGDEWVSNYLSDNKINFNTEYWNPIFEVVNRQENAFEVAKKYFTEIDSSKEYDEFQKLDFVKKFFNLLKQGWDEYDEYEQPPSYKELEILIKGIDAFEYGEDSLSFIRPDADAIENGFDNSWDFEEICKGYAEFADGYNESNVICRLDDMMIFDSDFDAAVQAKKDGYQFLEVGKDIIFPEEMLNDDIEYRNYIDTPENRTILKDFLSFAYEKQKEANQVKEAVQKFNKAESLTFGQFNSETNEIKLIKEAYFKELVIDENDTSKNKVVLGFKENGQEQLLEMGEVEYKNLLNAFGFSKEQQENTLEINKYKTFAEEKPEVVFDMIKSDYLGGTLFSDNKLIGYLKGLKKSNNYHHYLDELLFESLKQSDESLFSKVVDAGADLTWRREENGEPINILHYAAADNLNIAIKKIIEKTKSLEVDDYINLFSEENFEGHTPLEIAISNSGGEYFESTKLLIDAMDDEGFSGVEDLLIEDKFGNKVLYTSKDNLDCVSILCFDGNNNIISADTESLVDEKSLGEIISQDLIYQTNNNFIKGNIELNRSSKLISELKEVPQKLWDDELNRKLLYGIPQQFDPRQDFSDDFNSLIEIESIKRFLKNKFNEAKESILQGRFTKDTFIEVFEKTDIQDFFSKTEELSELKKFFNDDNWSPTYDDYKESIAEVLWENEIENLRKSISPKPFLKFPSLQFMLKNEDSECFLDLLKKDTDVVIDKIQASILLKYLQYEDWNFYKSVGDKVCILDISEDFTGEGKEISTKEIVDFAYRMMIKARDEEYSIYDVKDEEVFNDLRNKFGLIEEQKIKLSKDEKTSVVEQFFSKLKDSICDNAKLEDVLKSAASVLQTFSDTEKKEISQYLRNKDASLGNSGNGLSSILEIKEPGQKKKRSKADDDTRGR